MARNVLILVGVVLAMSACGRASKVPARIPQASDSLYTAQAALSIYGTQPEQALAIVDSALVIGNISPFRAYSQMNPPDLAAVFDELTNGGTHPVPAWLLKTILFLVRYVAPAALLAIAIFQIHE